ncbi:phosphoglycerate dehydrogenase [Chitinasiproducens palmae]|uniref:D-3-phosphoglycerate dehydrogenase n=1 Tax=Chitinasiproducens palmae TaxID=1770053 RepID=A0A1H2PJ91_9BURK|nr:phosphoglycerate dehydrogenase [Chitinasiproducens palmae]SDV46296.1 D-3-phosphoglycerate dehydrogenase [Chitinasiproducens palmae]
MTPVLLLEGIHQTAYDLLNQAGLDVERQPSALEGDALAEAIARTQLLGIRSATHVDAEAFSHQKSLLALGCFCIGTSQVDLDAGARAGIPVFNAPFSNTRSVAELVIAEAVLLLRRIPEKTALAHAGVWAKGAAGAYEARGKTIAVIGYGNIGSQVGVLAEALGMRVVYYDVQPKLPLGVARGATSLRDAVGEADVITLHVPATPATTGMITAEVLAYCKRGAMLINASRGKVVDIDALKAALDAGQIGGAAIDVFPVEPGSNSQPFESPLRGAKNVILTPHIGGSTQEAQQNIGIEVAAKLLNFLKTGATTGAVNFPEISPGAITGAARLLNVHGNAPGALARLNTALAEDGANICAQHLQTRGELGYVVTDLDRRPSEALLARLTGESGFIRSRVILPETV